MSVVVSTKLSMTEYNELIKRCQKEKTTAYKILRDIIATELLKDSPVKEKAPPTIQSVLTQKEISKDRNSIASMGIYSHLNEQKMLANAQNLGASKEEVRAIRLTFKEGRKTSNVIAKEINRKHKGEHLENLKSQKYRLARMQWQKEPLRKQALYERQTHGGWIDET